MSIRWPPVVERAAEIASTGPMTLRQCFYILFSEGLITNTDGSYKNLSRLTAAGRRAGTFPSFIDGTRGIDRYQTYDGARDAILHTARTYRRDRTEGQEWQVWIGGEKRTLSVQLDGWFGSELGCPVTVAGGYSSQTLCDDIRDEIDDDGRPAVLVYAGDFDCSGEDIARDFIKRVGSFEEVERVSVLPEQVAGLGLTRQKGKASDTRAAEFMERHGPVAIYSPGVPVQVEVEAVPPATLRELYQNALDRFWDMSAFYAQLARERDDIEELEAYLA